MARLQATRGLQNFLDLAVEQIRAFTGYDRVMAYKFAEDLSGHVVAEAKRDDLEPYLGLHYPATDIPAPARRMFSLSWLRHLPDVDYVPVPLVPENHPGTGKPIDMSYAILRSVSVMYSDYLKNMGVKSTMVMPLMKDGALWGLISAMHHSAPRHVPYEARMAAEILAHMLSLLTSAKEDAEGADNRLRMKLVSDQLVEALCREPDLHKSLAAGNRLNLLSLIGAQGAAVVSHGEVSLLGVTPSKTEVQGIAAWLMKANQPVVATDRLPELYEPAASFKAQASGVLGMRLSSREPEFLLWFRPEHIEIVNWAGDPEKPVKVSETDGEIRLMPRTSFALWKESVTGRCDPWHKDDKDAATNLRQAIMEVILSRAEEIERTNRALAEANIELDSFAYVASHDLKEPLRGIHHMASFIKRGHDGRLDPQAVQQLETILKLSRRMDDLIELLLQYSRTGRVEILIEKTDLDALVDEALISCEGLLSGADTEIRRPKRLGSANCDRVRLGEVLTNLISNAIKYNDKPEKWVEIGVEEGPTRRYYVADNGIGLEADERERIFEIFRRIHGPEEFGGGVGAGLTIARKIVERHGGRMWIELGAKPRVDLLLYAWSGGNNMTIGSIISVEDSDTDFLALQYALHAAGVTNPIERCETGRAAMECLLADKGAALIEKASLIMLDLNLPGIDGRRLLREFRARDPQRAVPGHRAVHVLASPRHRRLLSRRRRRLHDQAARARGLGEQGRTACRILAPPAQCRQGLR